MNNLGSMREHYVADFTQRFPTVAISVAAFAMAFVAVLGDAEERYIFTFAGTGEVGAGGDDGPTAEAQFSDMRGDA